MFKVICVTQRKAAADFFGVLEKICQAGADRIILREKDLTEEEYAALAVKAIAVYEKYGTPLSLHTYAAAAERLGHNAIHLSYADFRRGIGSGFETVGVSVHSLEEAVYAAKSGASYITAGHIFPTDCKKGLPPRGVDFLSEICNNVTIPVYAIGGIKPDNAALVKAAGAEGACLMSSLMHSDDPKKLIDEVRQA